MVNRGLQPCLLVGSPSGAPERQEDLALEVWEPPGGLSARLQGDSPAARRHFPGGARLRRRPAAAKQIGGPPVR